MILDGGASGSLTNLPFRPGVHAGEPELADGPAKKRDGGQPELRANHGLSRIGWLLSESFDALSRRINIPC